MQQPTFTLSQEFMDYRKWRDNRSIYAGVECVVDEYGYTQWNGEISVRAQIDGGGILPVPLQFTPFTKEQLDEWVAHCREIENDPVYQAERRQRWRQGEIERLQNLILKYQQELNNLLDEEI